MTTQWWEESPGVASSKRCFGAFMIAWSILMKSALFLVALLSEIDLPRIAAATGIADGLLYAGAALLGVTILEGVGDKIGGNVYQPPQSQPADSQQGGL